MRTPDFVSEGLALASLMRGQWKSREEVASVCEEGLRRLCAHASERVPFYRQRFQEAGVRSLRSLDDLASIPPTGKDDIRGNPEAMLAKGHPDRALFRASTTGTSGEALVHYMDRGDAVRGAAIRQFSFIQCGFGPADLMANMAFSRVPRFPLQPLMFRVRNIEPSADLESRFAALRSAAPTMVHAYPSVLAQMADLNLERGAGVGFPKAITLSEMMRPDARKKIERSFGCRIRNYYGASECWAIAWECEKGSLHINSNAVIVEAVDDAGQPVPRGHSGELLITSLWRYAMPFIRYRIGDRGSLGSGCSCGRGLQVLKSLDGRTSDFITLPSGRRFPWMFIENPFGYAPGIKAYQLVQEKPSALDIRVVADPGAPAGLEARIIYEIQSRLPEKMGISVHFVDHIERGSRGKMRDFISRLDAPSGRRRA